MLSEAEQIEMELTHRELARRSLLEFATYVQGDYRANWFHEMLCRKLTAFAQKKIRRLMIFAPPRHGKSELASRKLPAFIHGINPDARIIACSYTAELAKSMNRDVQRIMVSPEYAKLFPETSLGEANVRTLRGKPLRNADEYEVPGGRGFYKCAGVGGGITGRGFDFGLIDDPIKGAEMAYSPTQREKQWHWFTHDFMTRQQKDASILITLTRWHHDDIPGRILAAGLPFEVIRVPAIAESDEMHRRQGEALWPEEYPLEFLEEQREMEGPDGFNSLYQGDPNSEGGDVIKTDKFQWTTFTGDGCFVDGRVLPLSRCYVFQTMDLAVSLDERADYTVICTFAFHDDSHALILLDVHRRRLEAPDQIKAIRQQREKWRASKTYIEKMGYQLAAIQTASRYGEPVGELSTDSKDKVARTASWQTLIDRARFYVCHGEWNEGFLAECENFPMGKHDDQVDAAAYGGQIAMERMRGSGSLADVYGAMKDSDWREGHDPFILNLPNML